MGPGYIKWTHSKFLNLEITYDHFTHIIIYRLPAFYYRPEIWLLPIKELLPRSKDKRTNYQDTCAKFIVCEQELQQRNKQLTAAVEYCKNNNSISYTLVLRPEL